jgi:hypothetical protein
MKQTWDSEDLIERYLLGELSVAERTALENEYLVDGAKFERICRIEDDLLDRFARGALSPADRERVERQYLANPWRRRHVEFAKTFARVMDGEPTTRSAAKRTTGVSWRSQLGASSRGPRGALGLIPAIVALLIVLGGAWFAIETSRLRARLVEARREVEALRQRAQTQARQIADLEAQHRKLTEEHERTRSQLQAVKKPESSSHIAPTRVFLTLSVEAFRDSGAQGTQTLTIPRGVVEVRLRLALPENAFPTYRLTLLTEDDNEVFSKNGLRPRAGKAGDFVIASLPASKFTSGDNVLALSGINSTGAAEPLGRSMIKVRRP